MSSILMVDYYGTCDEKGKAIGHSPKVAREYRELFSEKETVALAVSPCIACEVRDAGFDDVYCLPYNIIESNYNKLSKRITDKFKLFVNIHHAFRIRGYDLLWFYRVDFFLFLYMLFAGKRKSRRICLIYQMGGGTGVLEKVINFVYKTGLMKFDGVIYTQPKMKIPVKMSLYMPDYWYKKDKYAHFAALPKAEKAVCLGAMNPYKQLEELVDIFNKSGYPLEIAGYFFDKARVARLKARAKENVSIRDCILSEEEYYEKLGGARYSILPYDMNQYKNRTSGILLESAFLRVIPVAPDRLLKENELSGIGYDSFSEIANRMKECEAEKILVDNQNKILQEYDEDHIKVKFGKWISSFGVL